MKVNIEIDRNYEMKRFASAVVGDLVWSDTFGEGKIQERDELRVLVNFRDCYASFNQDGIAISYNYASFNQDGIAISYNGVPSLFYRSAESNYLTERPAPNLDWNKVPVDTKVMVVDYLGEPHRLYFSGVKNHIFCFIGGTTSWTAPHGQSVSSWTNAELAELVTIDGVTYPIGTKWEGV